MLKFTCAKVLHRTEGPGNTPHIAYASYGGLVAPKNLAFKLYFF